MNIFKMVQSSLFEKDTGQRGRPCTYLAGNNYRGYGLFAALSFDDAKTWPMKKLLTDGPARFQDGGM